MNDEEVVAIAEYRGEPVAETTGVYTRLAQPGFSTPRPHFLGINLHNDRPYYIFSLICVGLLMLFLARLRASRFGRALMLAGTDRQAASSVGVSPWRAKIFAFALARFVGSYPALRQNVPIVLWSLAEGRWTCRQYSLLSTR